MSHQKEEIPAVDAAGDNRLSIHIRPVIVFNNPNPHKRWRGNPPLKAVPMSAELATDIAAMAKGGRDGKQ